MTRWPLPSLVLCLWTCASAAQGQVAVQSATPQAAAPGQTTTLTLRGQKLTPPLQVWSSLPGQVQIVPESAEQAKLQITVEAGTPPQLGGIVVGSAEGVSDPLFLAIDDLPSVADNGGNQALDKAQEVTLPTAIDGLVDGPQADVYKFTATTGAKLAIEVLATRLDSPLDPIVRLLNAQGQEIGVADDDVSTGADGRMLVTIPADGTYFVDLRDVRYRGGPGFRYRLRLGDFPLVSTPFPLGVTRGQGGQFTGLGTGPRSSLLVSLVAGNDPMQPRQPMAFRHAAGRSSGFAEAVASARPQFVEVEPNDTPETATPIAIPGGVSGQLQAKRDRDHYLFDAKAGMSWTFRPITRSVGSPCYLMLSIYKPDGTLLAESKSAEADEESLHVAFPADGTYRLVVDDLLRQGGSEFGYYIDIAPNSGFTLSMKPDKATPLKFLLAKNGTISLDVQAARRGYDGPITLSVEPASLNLVLRHNIINAKQPATHLTIVAPPHLNVGDLLALRIVGTAEHQGQPVRELVHTSDVARAKWPHLAYPPAWLDGLLTVGVAKEAEPMFTLTPSAAKVLYPRGAAQVVFELKPERKLKDFVAALSIVPENVPAGVTAEIKREGPDGGDKYVVTLKGAKEIGELAQEIRFVAHGEHQGQGQLVTATVPLQTITPLTLALAPTGPITPGQKQTIKVNATRYAGEGEDKQPITIKWKKLPPGVTAAGDTTIPADQSEATIELTATPEAAVGPFADVIAEATTKFQGQDVAAESPATPWEVK